MKKLYLITGASGHLGYTLLKKLHAQKETIRVLVLPGEEMIVKDYAEVITGNVLDKESLRSFFDVSGYDSVTLIHAAAKISIESKQDDSVWAINVEGTKNVMDLALENKIHRVIYVSSVHAIEEKKYPEIIVEPTYFDKDKVYGQYAKSKAEAARVVLEYAKKGLPVSIVHPSGIIGPNDIFNRNHSVLTLKAMYKGTIPVATSGGYDFVDVRDVVDGILACEEKGRVGECYLLTGEFISVKDMLNTILALKNKKERNIIFPTAIAKVFAPLAEFFHGKLGNGKPILTKYSLYTLSSNVHFSHAKAEKELGYHPRDIKESIRDSIDVHYVKA